MSARESSAGSDSDAVVIGHDDVSNYNPDQLLPQPPETLRAIRAWLQPTAYDIAGGEYKRHLASHVPGTGAWLSSSPVYQKWLDGDDNGLLWLRGIPGSGKSVMAASLIDGLAKAHPGCPVLFFFFRQIIDANHAPEALLRDWLDQLLDYSPPLQETLAGYVEDGGGIDKVSVDDLWKDLRMAFAQLPGRVFCVGDALDEMDRGHDEFLEALGALGRWRPGKVKVLITSRPVPTVEVPLRKVPCLRLRLEEDLVDVDISTYVRHSLARSKIPESDWKTIEDAVPGRANGLFLYAKLAMDAFLQPGAEIADVLRRLPVDLNELYTGLLDEHASRSGIEPSVQRLILQCVTHATRPLRLLELAEIIRACNPDGASLELKAAKALIRSACGPLLEVLPDETISVVHHSFTEYLKGTTRGPDASGYPVLEKGPTNAGLALACLEYLHAGCLEETGTPLAGGADPWGRFTGDPLDLSALEERWRRQRRYYTDQQVGVPSEESQLRLRHPFFEYAASNWHRHAIASESTGHDEGRINAEIWKFLRGEVMERWLAFRWGSDSKGVSQVHVAARLGLVSHLKEMVEDMDVDVPDADGKTPLWWAAYEGCVESLRELIAAGANPDRDDNVEGLKPLHQAAQRNHGEATKALLEAGVDPLTPRTRERAGRRFLNEGSSEGDTPLMYACEGGHVEAAAAFLPFLEDPDTLHHALAWAADQGHSKVVARILEHPGVDPNAKVDGDTPLYGACCALDPDTARVLLQAGADPNLESGAGDSGPNGQGKPGRYPIHAICGMDGGKHDSVAEEELFSILVEAGADIHRREPGGWTMLHGAVWSSPMLTRLLLDAGADASAKDSRGRTPLHLRPNAATMELLLELGCPDVNLKDNEGRTPLHTLLQFPRNRVDNIPKLLEYGADCNAADDWGNTALHIVLSEPDRSSPSIAKMLLDRGADPNARNREGLTPLLAMDTSTYLFAELLDMLLEAGADIDAEDGQNATLLFRMMADRRHCEGVTTTPEDDMRRLLDRGAKVQAADRNGRTLLHRAVQKYDGGAYRRPDDPTDGRIEFALELGADPTAVDRRDNGLLHELALREDNHVAGLAGRFTTLWEKVLSLGAGLHRNHAGLTPLHVLCEGYEPPAQAWRDEVAPGEMMPIDLAIARTADLDEADDDGFTALHLASETSVLYAKKLLDAGADPAVDTLEGMTPLHIAARDGRSNTIGLLLDALRKRYPTGPAVRGVNARLRLRPRSPADIRWDTHYTPLHFACRSGPPESVRLLLDAGADASDASLFKACARFEPARGPGEFGYDANLELEETRRIAEILDMLVEGGADVSVLGGCGDGATALGKALSESGQYMLGCFAEARARHVGGDATGGDPASGLAFSMHAQSYLKEASERALAAFTLAGDEPADDLFYNLVARRDYHLIEAFPRLGIPLHPSYLSVLAEHGFTSLLDKLGTTQATAGLASGDWHAHGDPSRAGLWFAKRDVTSDAGANPTPLIIDAVHAELPNMDVLRLLVEKFGVDVSEVHHKQTYSRYGGSKTKRDDSALHYVARGRAWWHVRQALPYLLARGADLEARGRHGRTPLQVALAGAHPFSQEAARALIEAGADVDAVSDGEKTCLVRARHDIPMLELLVARGATATPRALLDAVTPDTIPSNDSDRHARALEVLLSAPGADPNAYPLAADRRGGTLRETPLLRAGGVHSLAMRTVDEAHLQDREHAVEVVRVLLRHGAEPFATFHMREAGPPPDGAEPVTEVPEGYVEKTVLHNLFADGCLVDPFLDVPGLDVNHRNAEGETLLHVACHGHEGLDHVVGSSLGGSIEGPSIYRRLRDLGADLEARDNCGANVLHAIADIKGVQYGVCNAESLAAILAEAPHLADQPDRRGRTPLHTAIATAAYLQILDVARALIDGGADIHAKDGEGDTMLHVLARNLNTSALRALFEELVGLGLDPNARNEKGETPLFRFAARPRGWSARYVEGSRGVGGRFEVYTEKEALPLLRRLGVDFSMKDEGGRGALHVAAEGDAGRFGALMGEGLDGMAEDGGGRTAVDVAAACGNREILELFEKGD